MNTIRKWFAAEIEQLLPLLHETYRYIGLYQKLRSARHGEQLGEQLALVGPLLAAFARHVPAPKRPFFGAIADTALPLSDRIIALDIAVGAMHIQFAMERAYMHPISQRLREALEAARVDEDDPSPTSMEPVPAEPQADLLVRGIGASAGVAAGRAFVIRRSSDYRHIPRAAIVVATMTRPELVLGEQRPAGIVTDAGGALCHAAIVAREMGIPAVVGTQTATQIIRERSWIRIDGGSGEVRASAR